MLRAVARVMDGHSTNASRQWCSHAKYWKDSFCPDFAIHTERLGNHGEPMVARMEENGVKSLLMCHGETFAGALQPLDSRRLLFELDEWMRLD